MFRLIWDDVKREYSYGNMVICIIIINFVFFVIVKLFWVFLMIGNVWVEFEIYCIISRFFMIFLDWMYNFMYFWVIFIYMFFYEGVFYIFWNMLFLYWFGCIVGDFLGNYWVFLFYLLGGFVGGFIYLIIVKLIFNGISYVLGVFGVVMVIVVVVGIILFDYIMWLILLGDIKLKYIVGVLVFFDVVGMGSNINIGGYIVYFGGVFFGWLFVC